MSDLTGEHALPRMSTTARVTRDSVDTVDTVDMVDTDDSGEATGIADRVATFDQLFAAEHPSVVRMAYLMLGRTGEAEEVAQEAFTELLLRWGSIRNPEGYLRTVAVNRCRDIGRRRTVRDRALRRLRSREEPVAGDYLIDALQQLDVQLREVIVLRFYLDHTVPEIASILGSPDGTVKSRLHRALGRLGELLGDD